MRRKCIVISIMAILICAFIGILLLLIKLTRSPEIKEFSLDDYKWEIETFSSDRNVGQVSDADTAVEKAKKLWNEKFSENGKDTYSDVNRRKFEVFYDSNEKCWHVEGTLPKDTVGGVPHAIFRTNGEVLAVWHDD